MKAKRFFRAVSSVVLVTFVSLTMQPLQAAIQVQRAQAKNAPAPKAADEKYGETLRGIEEQSLKAKANRRTGKPSKAEAKAIRALVRELDALEGGVEAGFAATEKHLRDKKLAQVILDRHDAAVTTYRQKRNEFKALMGAVDRADINGSDLVIDAALASLGDFFEKHSQIRKRAKLDPNKLPWRTPEVTKRVPITDPKGFKTARFGFEQTRVAGPVPPGTPLPKALSAKPTPEDLAETEDAQITPAIRAKAQELGNDPLTIYNWVRNNIRFIPTYGSIQGSQDTLDKLSGNAFDTASLLIALLRSANVPARYAYGTIDVPVDQAMNWVGGVTKVEAAQQVLGQGGIPNAAITSGGMVRHIRMEHVWVEAWIDYLPSRGAQHIDGDTWIPMDSSFKQYNFSDGMNLEVSLDVAALLASAEQGATVNASEGWIQNLNHANALAGYSSFKTSLADRIESQRPNATVGQAFGAQEVFIKTVQMFAGSLPYTVRAQGPRYNRLPHALRHQFRYALYADSYDRNLDSPVWTFQRSAPELAGRRLTLSFRPATQADADLVASFLPRPPTDGGVVSLDELPRRLPSYIRVVAQLTVDGVVEREGGVFNLGKELAGLGGYSQYDFSGFDLTSDDTLIAGQPTAIALSIEGISTSQIASAKAGLERAEAKVRAAESVSADDLGGNWLSLLAWSYFSRHEGFGVFARVKSRMIDRPGLSYGLIHSAVNPIKLYGIVTTGISFKGVALDIGHLRNHRQHRDNNAVAFVAYNRIRGQVASLMEGGVLQYAVTDFSRCGGSGQPLCPQGVSAVSALTIAQSHGQRVYVITQSNQTAIESLGVSADIVSDIRDAVAHGKEVTIHQFPISADSWGGVGYTVVDPETGAGAYLIEGALNGAILAMVFVTALLLPMFLVSAGVVGLGMATIGTGLAIFQVYTWAERVKQASSQEEFDQASAMAAIQCLSNMAFAAIGISTFGYVKQFGGASAITAVQFIGATFTAYLGVLFDPRNDP